MTSCSLLPWVEDINNIRDWVTIPTEGDEYRYSQRVKYSSDDSWDESDFTIEIIDIEEKGDDIIIETLTNGSDYDYRGYTIIDKDKNLIASSDDEYYDKDNDFVILKTPVEIGNKWYGLSNATYLEFEIEKVGESKTVDAGTYNDCIVIVYSYSDINWTMWEMWYSPSAGTIIYQEFEDNSGYHSIIELKQIREN